jgi:hypothetical protein
MLSGLPQAFGGLGDAEVVLPWFVATDDENEG